MPAIMMREQVFDILGLIGRTIAWYLVEMQNLIKQVNVNYNIVLLYME